MKSCQQKAMETLLEGHGCANQLKLIMDHTESSDSSMEKEDLAKSVLHCLSDALSILNESNEDQVERKPLHKRGRKTSMAESSDYRRHESPIPIYHDGFLWRKYGQKQIKESDHQRSYYKCAYTKDHNCEAKKQVQMIQKDPPLYSTTYFGHHSCQLHDVYSTFPIQTSDPQDSHMIRFDQPTSFTHQQENFIMSQDLSPSHDHDEGILSPEVAHAVEAFVFNPFHTSSDLS